MVFTQEDYKKIEDWLKKNAIKDTDMVPWEKFDGSELIAIVQSNVNKTLSFEQLVGVINDIGITHVPGLEDYEKFIRERVNTTLLESEPVISEYLNDSLEIDESQFLNTVRYVEQELSDKQQRRARQNISAASQEDLDEMQLDRDKAYIQLQKDIESISIMADPKVGNIAYVNADILADPITDPDKYYLVYSVNALDDKVNDNLGKIDKMGTLGDLKTADKSTIVAAINEHDDELGKVGSDIGNLVTLKTNDKTKVVNAINELHDELNSTNTTLDTEDDTDAYKGINSLKAEVGKATDLATTTLKTDCTSAINEINLQICNDEDSAINMETEIFI